MTALAVQNLEMLEGSTVRGRTEAAHAEGAVVGHSHHEPAKAWKKPASIEPARARCAAMCGE